ncbi:hypothetical protein KAI04_03850 [Candidatus Pacearchaeota archaeon]|nr:hypothetical protein [Candidatus Pacearchaeota archaeon]
MTENNDTFVRITNQKIYDKLLEIEAHVKITNGKVKLNKWIATTALSLVIVVIGLYVKLIS